MTCKRSLVLALLLLVALAAATFVFRHHGLRLLGHALVVSESPDERLDGIILLMGGVVERTRKASELFASGRAERIYMVRAEQGELAKHHLVDDETVIARKMLAIHGVPTDAVIFLSDPEGSARVTSTREEADLYARAFTRQPDLGRRFYVVTSWYHTRRAARILGQALGPLGIELHFVAAPHSDFTADDWWVSEAGFLTVFSEYLKWVHGMFNFANFAPQKPS